MDAAPPSGAAGTSLPSVRQRPWIAPKLWHDSTADLGYEASDPYVRRFWTAAIGPGAVADLLRLSVAASRGRRLPRPVHLDALARNDLVWRAGGHVFVRGTIPPVPATHVRRLPPALREEHRRLRWEHAHRPG